MKTLRKHTVGDDEEEEEVEEEVFDEAAFTTTNTEAGVAEAAPEQAQVGQTKLDTCTFTVPA
jgi:hypothetical protein